MLEYLFKFRNTFVPYTHSTRFQVKLNINLYLSDVCWSAEKIDLQKFVPVSYDDGVLSNLFVQLTKLEYMFVELTT